MTSVGQLRPGNPRIPECAASNVKGTKGPARGERRSTSQVERVNPVFRGLQLQSPRGLTSPPTFQTWPGNPSLLPLPQPPPPPPRLQKTTNSPWLIYCYKSPRQTGQDGRTGCGCVKTLPLPEAQPSSLLSSSDSQSPCRPFPPRLQDAPESCSPYPFTFLWGNRGRDAQSQSWRL